MKEKIEKLVRTIINGGGDVCVDGNLTIIETPTFTIVVSADLGQVVLNSVSFGESLICSDYGLWVSGPWDDVLLGELSALVGGVDSKRYDELLKEWHEDM